MSTNRLTLIKHLQNPFVLDGRYSDFRIENCDPVTGNFIGKGSLSVVFRANDHKTGQTVAVKFFNPDHQGLRPFRADLFQRECDLLQRLVGKHRFVQLVAPIADLPITGSDPTGAPITIHCYYFVIEWLERDVADYFYRQDHIDAISRLRFFRNAVLSVAALHYEGLTHRDLKPDNLKETRRGTTDTIVIIDFGTAVDDKSSHIGGSIDYSRPVGATAYAPIETHCGLAGVRGICYLSDYYALGCMLFELFNVDHFAHVLAQDSGFKNCFTECYHHIQRSGIPFDDDTALTAEWRKVIKQFKKQVTIPNIDTKGNTVPAAVSNQLNRLLNGLTAVDFDDRLTDQNRIISLIDSTLLVLANEKSEARELERRRRIRVKRAENLQIKQRRLDEHLAKRKS